MCPQLEPCTGARLPGHLNKLNKYDYNNFHKSTIGK